MFARLFAAAASLSVLTLLPVAAQASGSCSDHRDVCEAVCTPDRVARFYGGVALRCAASCEPRWNQCLRTGIWADLERRSTGWWEPADRL